MSMTKNAILADSFYEDLARRVLAHHKIKDIARDMGVTANTISRTLNSPRFKVVYERVKKQLFSQIDEIIYDQRADSMTRINAFLPRALTEIFKLVESANSEKVRADSAKWVAGVCGISPIEKKVQADVPIQELSPEQIDALGRAMATAIKRDTPQIVTAELVDETQPTDGDGD